MQAISDCEKYTFFFNFELKQTHVYVIEIQRCLRSSVLDLWSSGFVFETSPTCDLRFRPADGLNIVPSTFLTSVLDKGNEGCNLCLLRMLTKVVVRLFVPPHMSCSITFDMGPILHFDS